MSDRAALKVFRGQSRSYRHSASGMITEQIKSNAAKVTNMVPMISQIRGFWLSKVAVFAVLSLISAVASAQAGRVDIPLQTYGPNVPSSGSPKPQALWVGNGSAYLCTHPQTTLAACQANPITTYTDSTEGTPCPSTAQLVQLPGTTCTASIGTASNLGAWVGSGIFDYFVVTSYGTYGPYTFNPAISVSPGNYVSTTQVLTQTMAGPLAGPALTMISSTIPTNGVSPFNFTFNNPDTTNAHYRGVAATCNVVNPGGACYGALIQENDNSNDSLKAHNVGLNVGIVNPNTSSLSNGTDEFGIAVTTNLGPLGTDSYWSGSGVRIEGTTPVQYGFNTTDGAAYIGLDLGALTATGTSQSQYLLMHGISAGSDSSNFALWSDSAGNGFIEPSGFSTSLTLQGTSVPSGFTNSYLLLQPNGQYVGVGTVSPFYQFDVLGTAGARTLVAYDSTAPTVSWVAGAAGSTKWSLYSGVTDPAAFILKDTASAAIAQFSPSASGGVYQVGGTGATYAGYGSVYEAPNTNAPYLGLEAWGGGGGTDFRQFRIASNSTPMLNFQYGIGTANGQTFATLATLDQYGNFKAKHHIASGTPTIACSTGAGTSPAVCTVTGNDEAGQIAVTTGSAPSGGAIIATITLANACPNSIYAVVRSSNANAASLTGTSHEFPDNFTATTWTITANSVGLAATTAYTWSYIAKCN